MPWRKKAQGQARKVEKERQQADQARAQQRASCKHFTMPENAIQDDLIAAESLLKEHVTD
jgi:chemotaxis response regulator CheB